MFERFTERARQVVVLAQEEARLLKHAHIGAEHILLGLLREEEGLGARVLASLEITVEKVRAEVRRIVPSGEDISSGQIPFTPEAKDALELALREALSLGHNYIGTEHILLGVVRQTKGPAVQILLAFDADGETIRKEVVRLLSGPEGHRWAPQAAASASAEFGRKPEDGFPESLIAGAAPLIETLAREIEEQLERAPDAGDLLLALACIEDGLLARVLDRLEVDRDAVQRAVEEARDEQRRLAQEAREQQERRFQEVLAEVRGRLGLAEG